ncbi:hypothetical protein ABZ832_22085 [Streptantibioticus parmotrematis]|uniref:hypothetical protein n=1 Tax=Streptantibioticus parmotrematis TaxID=2873249 RepID=UPI0033E63017
MKIRAILADVGRPSGQAANLLNAGWTATTAIQLPDGRLTLPGQCLAIFVEATWDQVNRPLKLVFELKDEDDHPVEVFQADQAAPARIEHQIIIPPVPYAPNGVPGQATVVADFAAGTFLIEGVRKRYIWDIRIGEVTEEVGFWVEAPMQMPTIGKPGPR